MCLGYVLVMCRTDWHFETGSLNFFLNLYFRNAKMGHVAGVEIQENRHSQKVLYQANRLLGMVIGVILIAWFGSFRPVAVLRGSFRPNFQTASRLKQRPVSETLDS